MGKADADVFVICSGNFETLTSCRMMIADSTWRYLSGQSRGEHTVQSTALLDDHSRSI